ncbi:MAG: threonine ammonia-lyase IlvA [Candidatus Sericytochromatia bacterium]
MKLPSIADFQAAKVRLSNVINHTPLMENINLSNIFQAKIYLKREDLQVVRSYKIRGAYNKISTLSSEQAKNGVVCASAGNHAQGVALSCNKLGINGKIYMPSTTTAQKIRSVKMFGKDNIEIVLTGDTFDDAFAEAMKDCEKNNKSFIHPFDDEKVIEGQGTVALEIYQDIQEPLDYIFLPIGGGGLAAGVSSYSKQISPHTKIIGVEPAGAPSMKKAFEKGEVITLSEIDPFVDGAAVKKVGNKNFEICKKTLEDIILIPEGQICADILMLYNQEGIIVEPAGALTVSALNYYQDKIKGKNVACVISGGNNDITRMAEINERSLLFKKLKHYFIIQFPQRAGALKEFLVNVLGPDDDICLFEYTKKTNRENGPALIGVELKNSNDYQPLIERMEKYKINYKLLNENIELFNILI